MDFYTVLAAVLCVIFVAAIVIGSLNYFRRATPRCNCGISGCLGTSGRYIIRISQLFSTKKRSDKQIFGIVQGLTSPKAWQMAYTQEANRIRRKKSVDRADWMKDFAIRAINIRIQQLKDDRERIASRTKAGGIGMVPIWGYWVGKRRDSTIQFRKLAIDSLGLGDSDETTELSAQAKAATKSSWLSRLGSGAEFIGEKAIDHWWDHSDFAAELQTRMMDEIVNEFSQQAALNFASEFVHVKPFIGQAIKFTKAARSCDRKMMKALDFLEPVAKMFHLRIFVVNSLIEVFPDEFGVDSSVEPSKSG